VTPELLAKEMAKVCSCDTIIDGFCGAGGNSIQFAFTCKKGMYIIVRTLICARVRIQILLYKVIEQN